MTAFARPLSAKRGFASDLSVDHMIEEYAGHYGHADLLRQAIDGVTGD
jgi:hypothetical protein